MTQTVMLSANKLSKVFGETVALTNVSIEISRGEVVALLGPNGAGKTTLMRLLTGFYTPNSGQIFWHGRELKAYNSLSWAERKIGYLPENNPLYPQMTVWEYLGFMSGIKGVGGDREDLAFAIDRTNLENVLKKKIETLSRGYKQRVGLAAALLGKPDLLILDEPTSGLDPNQAIEIRELIKEIAKKHAVLLSTHILPEVKAIASRLYVLNRGEIVLDSAVNKIKDIEKTFIKLTE